MKLLANPIFLKMVLLLFASGFAVVMASAMSLMVLVGPSLAFFGRLSPKT